MQRFIPQAAAAATLLALCGTASAQWTVRGGLTHIAPHSSASDAVGPMLPAAPSGISVEVADKATLFLSVAYALDPHMELELALGSPPTHDVNAQIAARLPPHIVAFDGRTLAEVRQIAPTLFFNYKFGDANSQWRPFVGVGVNYTKFDKRTSTAVGNAFQGGPTNIHMKDSWGLAAQVGVSYRINERWSVTGAIATAHVKSVITATTAGVARSMDIRFRPTVLTIAAGYTF